MDWSPYYPNFVTSGGNESSDERDEEALKKATPNVEILDIGCGFGGLLMALSPLFPNTLMLGRSFEYGKEIAS